VTQAIQLRIPNERPFHGVARLVVGGLAARHNLSYEALEDLQLALVTVLEGEGYPAAGEIRVELEVSEDSITMAIGPLNGETVRRDLEESPDGGLGLGRLLATLVEDAAVEGREDGDWLQLSKRVRGIKPAGASA
jgi:anti-sigma regulatory factor (Ser/Thr protein kinase)